ncbi:MAG TPA: fumarylacetoacetase [Burkholderiales bacterium]|nr:fumarylacetoacetase [Burkholderiales bacterium]
MHPNDSNLKSFIEVAPDSNFPIQNLPFGVFSSVDSPLPRVGVAIGNEVLDLMALEEIGLLSVALGGSRVFDRANLNAFMSLGRLAWRQVRLKVSELLRDDNPTLRDNQDLRARVLRRIEDVTMHLPVAISGYTDFYSSKEHATNVGSMFRDPKNALLPNWLHMPIAYNGRASSVVVSGTPVRRPMGQSKSPEEDHPVFGPCRKLDFELETAFIIGEGNDLGEPIAVNDAHGHMFGMVLLNDWSARDIQQWEYAPLGPFNGKTFATSISPWVVTMEALEPFRVDSPSQNPEPLPYLRQSGKNAYDLTLEVSLKPRHAKEATTICRTNFRSMYWTMAQQLAHHTVSGCNTRVGDLMGSGTISGPTPDAYGSILELAWNGQKPLTLMDGATRIFLEDGDEVLMTGWSQGEGYRVGFGHVSGVVLPAYE